MESTIRSELSPKQSILPEGYVPKLDFFQTEMAIKLVKDTFERKLAEKLSLQRVSAPRFLKTGTGIQDDLAGTQIPVSFVMKHTQDQVEVVHSLAKWKRYALGRYGFKHGTGLYTDMDAVRKDEDLSEIHSIYVDQWDWERIIFKEERSLDFLRWIVKEIYSAILETETVVEKEFPELAARFPKEITFIHAQDLEDKYPGLSVKEKEDAAAKEYGAIFIIGIGYPLKSGQPHDLRAADYDDWTTEAEGKRGLNGDIIIWDSVRGKAIELSSMGVRVDKESLLKQLDQAGLSERKELAFHQAVLKEKLPLSVGGGIGQSRLCMALLQKAHIGEVQSSIWPEEVEQEFERRGIVLL